MVWWPRRAFVFLHCGRRGLTEGAVVVGLVGFGGKLGRGLGGALALASRPDEPGQGGEEEGDDGGGDSDARCCAYGKA